VHDKSRLSRTLRAQKAFGFYLQFPVRPQRAKKYYEPLLPAASSPLARGAITSRLYLKEYCMRIFLNTINRRLLVAINILAILAVQPLAAQQGDPQPAKLDPATLDDVWPGSHCIPIRCWRR
jgi:hypothetical protein